MDAEEVDDRDEDEEDHAVPVENESYVKLRKMMVKRHDPKMGNLLQENSKLRQEFQRKRVKKKSYIYFIFLNNYQF